MPTKRWYEAVGQEVVDETLPIGLRVVVLPKPGFQTRFATFATKYGGMDNEFRQAGGDPEFTTVPAGIAHFLEHKLFEQPDGTNILDLYSRMGVEANAGTYKNRTAYLFSVTDDEKFLPAFDILLDYVQTPYFTDENVSKEQGIIQQEIVAGLDRPGTVAWQNFEAALYHKHPAALNIAGTVESVNQITKEHLYLCHSTFYHPSNMIVVVAGDVDPEAVVESVRRDMTEREYAPPKAIERPAFDEPASVREQSVSKQMKVSRPIVLMGYKGPVSKPNQVSSEQLQRRRFLGSIVSDALLGRTTEWYWKLYSAGVVTRDFSYGFTDYATACHLLIYGETEDKDGLVDEVSSVFESAKKNGLSKEDFELARRAAIGRFLSSLDSPEELALRYVGDALDGIDALTTREALESLTLEQANDFLEMMIRDDRRVVSTVEPLNGEAEGK